MEFQYQQFVDIHARSKRKKPSFQLEDHYGQVLRLFVVDIPAELKRLEQEMKRSNEGEFGSESTDTGGEESCDEDASEDGDGEGNEDGDEDDDDKEDEDGDKGDEEDEDGDEGDKGDKGDEEDEDGVEGVEDDEDRDRDQEDQDDQDSRNGDNGEDDGDGDHGNQWIFAVIRSAKVDKPDSFGTVYYGAMGETEVVDLNTVQCVIGRIHDGRRWGIVDRSGGLAQLGH